MGRRIVTITMGVALIAAVWVSSANAFAIGQFTRAEAAADWSHGSFAGSVTWNDCGEFCVSYNIYVFDEPSVNSCDGDDWERAGSDPNVRQLWESSPRNVNETIQFEGSNVDLIPGVYGQRLCLIGVQTEENGGKTFHPQLINQTLFQVPPPPPAPPVVNTTTITTTTPTSTVSEACKKARARVKRLRNLRRRAQNHHKPKQARKLNLAIKRAQKSLEAAC